MFQEMTSRTMKYNVFMSFKLCFVLTLIISQREIAEQYLLNLRFFFFFGGGGGGVIRHTFGSFIDLIMASVTFWPDFGV